MRYTPNGVTYDWSKKKTSRKRKKTMNERLVETRESMRRLILSELRYVNSIDYGFINGLHKPSVDKYAVRMLNKMIRLYNKDCSYEKDKIGLVKLKEKKK